MDQFESIEGHFYNDLINDSQLLELIDYPLAINPDKQLVDIGIPHNWPVLQWEPMR